jgi:3-methyl-2-oxobutanoate hydroxymethyltransferase
MASLSTFTLDTATSRATPSPVPGKRMTVPALKGRKTDGVTSQPIVMLTAYTMRTAQLLDPHCDLLLVGDSLGQVIYGLPSTVPVTLDMMIAHGAAARVMKETGCAAVKLEGGQAMASTIRFLVERGIPVIAHVGLTPQAVNALGGYGARGRSEAEAAKILADAHAVAGAGAFAVVLEGVMEALATEITRAVAIPTIGIGASAECDGQVLVTEDMLGLFERTPRFVKRYDDLATRIGEAVGTYAAEVRSRAFPTSDQTYRPKA